MASHDRHTHRPSPSLGRRSTDHLFINTEVANSLPVETSRFSPVTPPARPDVPSSPGLFWNRARRDSTSNDHTHSRAAVDRDVESDPERTTQPRISRFRDRFTRLVFDLRTFGNNREADIIPMHASYFPEKHSHQKQPSYDQPRPETLVGSSEWPPLHVEKRRCPCRNCDETLMGKKKAKKQRRRRIWIIVLVIIILYLLANTVFLNVKIIALNSPSSSGSTSTDSNSTSSTPTTLSADAQQCLSEFTLNAPTSPSSFPCSSCLSVLQAVPTAFINTNAADGQQITNAVQFCGLSSVFSSVDSAGQQQLGTGSWLQDVKFCAWSGVTCDGSGLVSSLQLSFPAVPASIPDELGALSGLATLELTGNGQVPGGSLPSSFTNLTSLTTLQLASTGVTALPDTLFQMLSKLGTVTLVQNAQMGSSLPSSLTSSSVQSLIVNNQTLSNPLAAISGSTSLQGSLKLLDLSSTGLTGSIPSSIASLSSLTELHLDSNALSGALPALSASLQILTLKGNPSLSGAPPSGLCTSSALKTCTVMGTGLAAPSGGCGVCEFGAATTGSSSST